MIEIRLATPEDRDNWNDVVLRSPYGVYNCVFEWKEVVEEGLGIEVPFVLAEDGKEIVGIYPAFLRSDLDIQIQSPFSDAWNYCTPYVTHKAGKGVLKNMIKYMESFADKKNVKYIRIMPYIGSPLLEQELKDILLRLGYRQSNLFVSQIIDLTKSVEDLRRDVKKRYRKYIRKTLEDGIQLVESTDKFGLAEFYACLQDMQQRKNIYIPPYSLYEKALELLGPKKLIRIHLVKYETKTIGGLYTTYFKDLVCTASAGCLTEYLHLNPYHALYWNIITASKELGYQKLDTGGLPPSKSGGLYFFKTRFGGNIRDIYGCAKKIKKNILKKQLDKVRGFKYSLDFRR